MTKSGCRVFPMLWDQICSSSSMGTYCAESISPGGTTKLSIAGAFGYLTDGTAMQYTSMTCFKRFPPPVSDWLLTCKRNSTSSGTKRESPVSSWMAFAAIGAEGSPTSTWPVEQFHWPRKCCFLRDRCSNNTQPEAMSNSQTCTARCQTLCRWMSPRRPGSRISPLSSRVSRSWLAFWFCCSSSESSCPTVSSCCFANLAKARKSRAGYSGLATMTKSAVRRA
mmetsp:Transcript_43174/g.124811  ORF Transcript_43174/g.124811 Transcript_43174/m.124811 type:complete len:223 (+) Transcript_43174:123-791(+)